MGPDTQTRVPFYYQNEVIIRTALICKATFTKSDTVNCWRNLMFTFQQTTYPPTYQHFDPASFPSSPDLSGPI